MDDFSLEAIQAAPEPEPEKPAKPRRKRKWSEKTLFKRWYTKLEGLLNDKWVSFEDPELGKVWGFCVQAAYTGDEDGIPDFKLTVQGARSVRTVQMLETYAQFHDTEQEAIDRWKETDE